MYPSEEQQLQALPLRPPTTYRKTNWCYKGDRTARSQTRQPLGCQCQHPAPGSRWPWPAWGPEEGWLVARCCGGFELRNSIKHAFLAYCWRMCPFAAEGSEKKFKSFIFSGRKVKNGMSVEGLCFW